MNIRMSGRLFGTIVGAALLALAPVTGCSSDSTDAASSSPSPSVASSSALCTDVDTVQADLDKLSSMDISVSNASAVGAAVEQLGADVQSLATAGSGTANADVAKLQDSITSLTDSVKELGKTSTVADVGTALTNVSTTFDAMKGSLDCS